MVVLAVLPFFKICILKLSKEVDIVMELNNKLLSIFMR